MRSVDSIKNKLYNLSLNTGKTMQELLTMYCLERTLYRISISSYSDNFTLKGGILLYALFNGNYARATADVDLLAERISNNLDYLHKIFKEILMIDYHDQIRYEIESLKVISITENKKYHGANVSIMAYLDRTQVNVSFDIGFGDTIYPSRVKMDYPVLLDDDIPRVYAYSIYSCLSEKFEALVSLGYNNSRLKDFYDIYVIAISFNLDGKKLFDAINETLKNRNTNIDDIVVFNDDFVNNEIMIKRWNSFVKKKRAMINVSFEDTMLLLHKLFLPIIENNSENINWDHEKLIWIIL